jgi:hypothetical protein
MQLHQYQDLAMRTAKMFPTLEENLDHAALGIGSEVGEFALTICAAWMKMPFEASNFAEELGDASWYSALACHHMGWRFENLFLDPATLSDMSPELAVAVVNRNPPAMALMMAHFGGEVIGCIKDFKIYKKQCDADRVKKYLTLFVCTLSLLADAHSFSYANVALQLNIEKLRKRYPDRYSDADAIARADKVIIESSSAQTH